MNKVIIAGGRNITDYNLVSEIITDSGFIIDEVVSGCAKGVDSLGERWAKECGKSIKKFPANWSKYGKAAGPIRNRHMADYADCLIAIMTKNSKGTKSMIDEAEKKNLFVYVEVVD